VKVNKVATNALKWIPFMFWTFKSDHLEFLYTLPRLETVFCSLAPLSNVNLNRDAKEWLYFILE
jgi:hypothetical protein